MRLTRVIARLEPGGAQLGIVRITPVLARLGIETRVLAGYATRAGRRLFAAAGVAAEVWRGGDERIQDDPRAEFADWLVPRLPDAGGVDAPMFGAWGGAAPALARPPPPRGSGPNQVRGPPPRAPP